MLTAHLSPVWANGSQPEFVVGSEPTYELSRWVHLWVDPHANHNWPYLHAHPELFTVPDPKQALNFGLSGSVYWMRLPLRNRSGQGMLFFQINFPPLNDVTFYLVRDTQLVATRYAGSAHLGLRSEYAHYVPSVAFEMQADVPYVLYARVRSESMLHLPISVSQPAYWVRQANVDRSLVMLVLGALWAIAFINLVMFTFLRDRSFLFLSLSLFSIGAYLSALLGLQAELGIDLGSFGLMRLRLVLYLLAALFTVLLAGYLLDVHRRKGIAFFGLATVFVVDAALLLFALLVDSSDLLMNRLGFLSFPVNIGVVLGITLLRVRHSRYEALVFSLAQLGILVGGGLFVASLVGYLPRWSNVHRMPVLGAFAYGSLLTFLLTLKFLRMRNALRSSWDVQELNNRLRREIESRMMAEIELRENNLSKDKFISIIAHDLKSPFNAILGFGQLLETIDLRRSDDKARRYIAQMVLAAQKAFQLLEDLLTWSRAQTGAIQFEPEHANLSALIDSVLDGLEPVAQRKGIGLVRDYPPNFYRTIDTNMLGTVVRNLVSNALKFTHEGGTVSLRLHDTHTETQLAVADTGVGMSAEVLDRLFRLDANQSTRGTANETGTGLGLLVCKEFAERHGGSIWAESAVGEGSTFFVSVPH